MTRRWRAQGRDILCRIALDRDDGAPSPVLLDESAPTRAARARLQRWQTATHRPAAYRSSPSLRSRARCRWCAKTPTSLPLTIVTPASSACLKTTFLRSAFAPAIASSRTQSHIVGFYHAEDFGRAVVAMLDRRDAGQIARRIPSAVVACAVPTPALPRLNDEIQLIDGKRRVASPPRPSDSPRRA